MKHLMYSALALGLAAGGAQAQEQSRLDTALERGKLLCSGHNGSFLGFAEVNDQGEWTGMDIDLCKGCLLYTSPSPRDRG